MEANELRIGNYVQGSCIVENLLSDGKCTIKTQDCRFLRFSYKDLEPIPLTEEWLLKFGYKFEFDKYYCIQGHIIWKCNDLLMCDKNGIILKHVHQLQNLYFALTGEELTVN